MRSRVSPWLAVSIVLGAILSMPGAMAAPTVANSSTAAVFVGSGDYVEFYYPTSGQNLSAVGVNRAPLGPVVVTAPNGQQLTFTVTIFPDAAWDVSGPVSFYLNGTPRSGDSNHLSVYTATGNLLGQPADASWQYASARRSSSSANVFEDKLVVANKSIASRPNAALVPVAAAGNPVFGVAFLWNWHLTTGAYNNGVNDLPAMQTHQETDPNQAKFYSDTTGPDVSPYSAYTLNYGAPSCGPPATSSVNGAWLGASGTVFSRFTYADGNFLGSVDLRIAPLSGQTAEENEGATVAGTDAKSIPYNNAAGTSYQFMVRNTTGAEALGAVQFIPPGLCVQTAPTIAITDVHDEEILDLTVSQAQCSNDLTSLAMDVQIGNILTVVSSLNIYIQNAANGSTILTIPQASMFAIGNRVQYASEGFAPGAYVAVAKLVLTGVGSGTFYDSAAFNVPRGSCVDTPTDLSPVLLAIQSSTATLQGNISTEATAIRNLILSFWTDYNATEAADLATTLASLNVTQSTLIQFWSDYNTTALADVTAILNAIASSNANATTFHAIQNATLNNIYNVVQGLNLTIDCGSTGNETCNFYMDNETLQAIYDNLTIHRNDSLEVNGMSFQTLGFDGFLFFLFWMGMLLLFLIRGKVFAAFAAVLGVIEAIIPDTMPGSTIGYLLLFALAVWLEAIAGEKIYARWLGQGDKPKET